MLDKKQHVIVPVPDCEPGIGRTLWMLEDARQRTRRTLENLHPAAVDWIGGFNGHNIGTLLYHIAAIEIDWLHTEVTEGGLPASVWEQFPYEVRDARNHLTIVTGVGLDEHWRRLDFVRGLLLDVYKPMTLADYRRPRQFEAYAVTPEWVLHHLMQHEAGHRDELGALRGGAEKALNLAVNP
jgi:uncharacterized damage-inducible protein DinB